MTGGTPKVRARSPMQASKPSRTASRCCSGRPGRTAAAPGATSSGWTSPAGRWPRSSATAGCRASIPTTSTGTWRTSGTSFDQQEPVHGRVPAAPGRRGVPMDPGPRGPVAGEGRRPSSVSPGCASTSTRPGSRSRSSGCGPASRRSSRTSGRFALEVDDEQELLDIAVKLLADGLGVSLTAAMRVGDDPDWLEIVAGTGWDAGLLGTMRVSADPTTLAGFTLDTDGPVVCDGPARPRRGSRAGRACAATAWSAP